MKLFSILALFSIGVTAHWDKKLEDQNGLEANLTQVLLEASKEEHGKHTKFSCSDNADARSQCEAAHAAGLFPDVPCDSVNCENGKVSVADADVESSDSVLLKKKANARMQGAVKQVALDRVVEPKGCGKLCYADSHCAAPRNCELPSMFPMLYNGQGGDRSEAAGIQAFNTFGKLGKCSCEDVDFGMGEGCDYEEGRKCTCGHQVNGVPAPYTCGNPSSMNARPSGEGVCIPTSGWGGEFVTKSDWRSDGIPIKFC